MYIPEYKLENCHSLENNININDIKRKSYIYLFLFVRYFQIVKIQTEETFGPTHIHRGIIIMMTKGSEWTVFYHTL